MTLMTMWEKCKGVYLKRIGYCTLNKMGEDICLVPWGGFFRVFLIKKQNSHNYVDKHIIDLYDIHEFRLWFNQSIGEVSKQDPTHELLYVMREMGWIDNKESI